MNPYWTNSNAGAHSTAQRLPIPLGSGKVGGGMGEMGETFHGRGRQGRVERGQGRAMMGEGMGHEGGRTGGAQLHQIPNLMPGLMALHGTLQFCSGSTARLLALLRGRDKSPFLSQRWQQLPRARWMLWQTFWCRSNLLFQIALDWDAHPYLCMYPYLKYIKIWNPKRFWSQVHWIRHAQTMFRILFQGGL